MRLVAQVLEDATGRLITALGLPTREARIEARALASHAWQTSTSWLLAHDQDALSEADKTQFAALLARREKGEPVAYIVGKREFFGLYFLVTPAVLIPRPETELLVQAALDRLAPNDAVRVLDLGTGSGAIAATLGRLRPLADVLGVDASADALNVARTNAQVLATHNVSFAPGDWYDQLCGQTFGMIIANPPYVEANDPHLNRGDARFEPVSARASGITGLEDLEKIISGAPTHISLPGFLLVEHGWDQGESCRRLFLQHRFSDVATLQDLAGHERVTLGRYSG